MQGRQRVIGAVTVVVLLAATLILSVFVFNNDQETGTSPQETQRQVEAAQRSTYANLLSAINNSLTINTDPGAAIGDYIAATKTTSDIDGNHILITTNTLRNPTSVAFSVGTIYCYEIPIGKTQAGQPIPGVGIAKDGKCPQRLDTTTTPAPAH